MDVVYHMSSVSLEGKDPRFVALLQNAGADGQLRNSLGETAFEAYGLGV